MKAPLYNKLIQYSSKKYPFHMPGHKFGRFGNLEQIKLHLLDATEANGLDNLYEAEEVIKEAMELMADFYAVKETIFLTNGSTAGILASILSICKPGEKILVARNCHHSVWSALVLSGAIPIYVSPTYRDKQGIIGEIRTEEIKRALEKYPEVKGAIIVSPTYEGIVSDIQGIADTLHKKDKILVVDEAHGAHFEVSNYFPKSSSKQGADLVIHSMHKTLPTLTQSALLHICSDRVSKEQVISSLKMVQTSSPSYIMMSVMDYMRGYIEENRNNIESQYIKPLIQTRKDLQSLKYLSLLDEDMNRYDISKIIILTQGANINGYELAQQLEEKYDIGVEAAQNNFIILMSTIADGIQNLAYLKKALMEIDRSLMTGRIGLQIYKQMIEECKQGKAPREIYFKDKEWKLIDECINRTCSKNIMLYPPGIPLVCIGEQITEAHIQIIKQAKEQLQGIKIENNQIHVYIKS